MLDNTQISFVLGLLSPWNIIKYFICSVIIFLLAVVIKIVIYEISHYFAIKSYSKIPGIATYYKPIVGYYWLSLKKGGNDQQKAVNEFFEEHSDSKMIVTNIPGLGFGQVHVLMNSNDAIKDFVYKEHNYGVKADFWDMISYYPDHSLAESNKQMKWRAVHTEFFIYDHLKSLLGPMYTIIGKQFDDLVKNQNITNSEFKKIDLNELLEKIMADMISLLLFGMESVEDLDIDQSDYPEVTNAEYTNRSLKSKKSIDLIHLSTLFFEEHLMIIKDFFNLSFMGLPYKFGVKKTYNSHKILKKFLFDKIIEIYDKRYNETERSDSKKRCINILDLIVDHNKNCIKNNTPNMQLETSEVVTSVIVFFVAGFDTSLQATTSGLMWMSQNHQDWLTKIKSEGVSNIAQIEQNYSLDLSIKEIQRLYNPGGANFPRTQFKEMEIAGVKFPKKTSTNVITMFSKWDKKWIDSRTFRPERFENEVQKLGRLDYIPFYAGKRKCIGYHMGLFNIKIMMGYLIDKLELNVDKDYQIKMAYKAVYCCSNPTIEVKLR